MLKSMQVTALLVCGERITDEVEYNESRGGWQQAMHAFGQLLCRRGVVGIELRHLVVVSDTDVMHYTGGEPAEILGMEG